MKIILIILILFALTGIAQAQEPTCEESQTFLFDTLQTVDSAMASSTNIYQSQAGLLLMRLNVAKTPVHECARKLQILTIQYIMALSDSITLQQAIQFDPDNAELYQRWLDGLAPYMQQIQEAIQVER